MLSEASLEKSRTEGDFWVLSVIIDNKPARINILGGETSEELVRYIIEKLPQAHVKTDGFDITVLCDEVFELGVQQWSMKMASDYNISPRKYEETGGRMFLRIDDDSKVEAFNSKWRIHCFKEALRRTGMREKISYDEAVQALREFLVVEPVLNS